MRASENPFHVAANQGGQLSFLRTPVSGVRMNIDSAKFQNARRGLSVSERFADVQETQIRIVQMNARYNIVLGTLFGALLGFSVALAAFRINGVF